MIDFRLDLASGVPPYLEIVQQFNAGVQLGQIAAGEQLPTVETLAGELALNRNTVVKAYHELKGRGLVTTKPGCGTFVATTLCTRRTRGNGRLQHGLERWLDEARRAGLDDDGIRALVSRTLVDATQQPRAVCLGATRRAAPPATRARAARSA